MYSSTLLTYVPESIFSLSLSIWPVSSSLGPGCATPGSR